jgi:hypothetical protein
MNPSNDRPEELAGASAPAENKELPPLSSAEINLFGALIVTMSRVYDAQLMILMEMNPDSAVELRAMHERGELWAPPPAFIEDLDDEG